MSFGLVFFILLCAAVCLLFVTRGITSTYNVLVLAMLALLGYAAFGWPF